MVSLLLYWSLFHTLSLGEISSVNQNEVEDLDANRFIDRQSRSKNRERNLKKIFNPRRRGKRANGSALPLRLTDWKENPSAIRSVLIRSDSRRIYIPVSVFRRALFSLTSSSASLASISSAQIFSPILQYLTQTDDAWEVQWKRRFLEREIVTWPFSCSAYANIFVVWVCFFFSFYLGNIPSSILIKEVSTHFAALYRESIS